jgi:hypothetical protein
MAMHRASRSTTVAVFLRNEPYSCDGLVLDEGQTEKDLHLTQEDVLVKLCQFALHESRVEETGLECVVPP